ncbi:penicillin acylase family protein [Cytobacillus spongiae]|uniref:penicillin acylase family protein n=1 Tax=Cytobacillus spongiae TaxID=2901381 RepID=UPI001F212919|nr:penicillin acylase family protein [Cytobacillus spongiae]UII54280.1 penicillin acylase family protein [Cytobacillus spongiae]
MEAVIEKQPKPRKNWLKILIGGFILLVTIAFIIFTSLNAYTARSLPKIAGEIKLDGLQDHVTVLRDVHGVPHIQAANDQDLYIAQGYVQAQDRLFQMDLSRRQASGTLSEVIGEATVDNDKYFRTLGLRRAAEASFTQYSPEAKQVLEWFAFGINTYIQELKQTGRWPVEFTLLGYEPDEWSPIDSLTIGKYMAFDLGGHWQDQAFRYYLLQTFPLNKAYELFPSYPKDAPTIISKQELDIENSFVHAVIPHEFNGSNNWVVSGEKSESGKPLLADDPHLSLATPSIWYQSHLESPNVNVSGVIFAGIPGIILGHNEHIAWGVTNTGPDVQDLYIEKRNPENPEEFLYNDQWEQASIIQEPITVKGGKKIDYEVIITRHGPVISDFAEEMGEETVLSLQWTALEPSNELEAVLNMNQAANWNEFEKALEKFHTPAQNFVFASNDGTIAYKANGHIPIRKKGDGLLPVPGWTDEYGWEGFIPYDELPRIVNPAEGFISTANNKVIGDDYPYHISHNWAQPFRQMRIQEVLSSKEIFSVEDMMELQMDPMNLQAREFVPLFIEHLPKSLSEKERKAIEVLSEWNYLDSPDESAPIIFHIWMKNIKEVLFENEISPEMMDLFNGQKQAVDQLIRRAAEGEASEWMSEKGGLSEVLAESLIRAIKEITEVQGKNIENWQWGEYHQIQFSHPLSVQKPLNYLFNRKKAMPVGGSSVTVQAAAFREDGTVNHGGSWRFVIDTADLSLGYHLVGPGQSGHVQSKWYQDQMDDWVNGDYHETKLNESDGFKLILKPLAN